MNTLWLTYTMQYGKSHSPVEHDPNSFVNVCIHFTELSALRHMQKNGGQVVEVPVGFLRSAGLDGVRLEWVISEGRKPTPAWKMSS